MEKTIKIVFAVIMVLVAGSEAEVDLEDLVKEIRIEMMEVKGRLTLTEEKLLLTQDELIKTKEEQKMTKEDLLTTKDDLAKDVCIQDLKREVSFLKDPPWTFACGAHYDLLSITSQAISYTTLLYFSNNVAGASLDIDTGVFTSGHPGTYTATWSLLSGDDAGDDAVEIYLRKNEGKIEESRHFSRYSGPSGKVDNPAGRTLVLHLDRGDTLDLYCVNCSSHIFWTTFCVSLSQFDVE